MKNASAEYVELFATVMMHAAVVMYVKTESVSKVVEMTTLATLTKLA